MLLLIAAQLALADIPPPPGYVEQCTLSRYPEGCVTCEGYHGGREPCEALEKKGYERQCQTGGASVWTEIMCPGPSAEPLPEPSPEPEAKKSPDAPSEEASTTPKVKVDPSAPDTPAPADQKSSRCASLAPASAPAGLLLVLAMLGLRRRR